MSKPLNKHGIKFSVEIIGFGEEDTYFQVHDPLFFDETYLQATMFWYIAHMFKSIGMHFDVPCYFGPIIDELNQRFEREYELKQDSKNG